MFVNLSTENIMFYDDCDSFIIPFVNVENELSNSLIGSYKQHTPLNIYVLNGPWSFTNLRVWSLILNTLLLLDEKILGLNSINKLDLYSIAVNKWYLPRYWYLFIGQRKNVWYYDFVEKTYVACSKDCLEKTLKNNNDNFFVDMFIGDDFEVFFKYHENSVSIFYQDKDVFLQFNNKVYSIGDYFPLIKTIEPYYAIEPNIW